MPPLYATEEKVKAGFDAAAQKFTDMQGRINEITAVTDQIGKQLRRMYGGIVKTASDIARPKTFWRDEDQAAAFGALVFAAAGKAKCIKSKTHSELIEKALGEGTNIGGGYAVPSDMLPRIIDLLGTYGKFRSNASVVPMGSDITLVPSLVTDALVYCPGENTEIDEGDLQFGQVRMVAKTWAALLAVSNELSEDSLIAIGEIVARSITRSMAKKEDEIGFVGDGTETYFGMRGITGIFKAMLDASVVPAGLAIGTGNAYSELVWGDFEEMFSLLPEDFEENAKVYCSKSFFYSVIRRAALDAGDNATGLTDLLSPNKTRYVNGYPVEFVRSMPRTEANAQVCCLFGDLQSGAYLGERRQLAIDSSEHVLFKKNQTCIRGIERIDINVFGCGDATNPGCIVGLRTADS